MTDNQNDFAERVRELRRQTEETAAAWDAMTPAEKRDSVVTDCIRSLLHVTGASDADDDIVWAVRNSHHMRGVVTDLIDAGLAQGMEPRRAAGHAREIVGDVIGAIGWYLPPARELVKLWGHCSGGSKGKAIPDIDRAAAEAAAARYLAGPLRAQSVDRMLVDMLVYQELSAYAWNVRHGGNRRHPLWAWFLWRFWTALGFATIATIVALFGDATVTMWTAVGFLAFYALETAAMTVWLVRTMAARMSGRYQTSAELLHAMAVVYDSLRSDGVISARHILDRANDADKIGVGWPPSLYAILDDVIARTGRF